MKFIYSLFKYLLILSITLFIYSSSPADINIDADFESGNISNVSQLSTNLYSMQLRHDTNAKDNQWFYFRVTGAKEQTLTLRITNLSSSNVPSNWNYLHPVISSDLDNWSSIEKTNYEKGNFEFTTRFSQETEYIAYYYPYPYSRITGFINSINTSPWVTRTLLTRSEQGRNIDLLKFTNPAIPDKNKKGIWIIARQHAGETPGSWNCEGLMEYLLSGDTIANQLLNKCVFNIVPMMNPDGVIAGNYRENSLGINLNRVWNTGSQSSSPSVYTVLKQISTSQHAHPFNLFIDLHGDSGSRKNYIYCFSSTLVSPENYKNQERFLTIMEQTNGDFTHAGSPQNKSISPRISFQRIHSLYGNKVQSYIYEMTYLYPDYEPNKGRYMTIERNKALGKDLAKSIYSYFFENTLESNERANIGN